MSKHILITGGAGFVGSHLADELLAKGYQVRVLDNLTPQVHGPDARRPDYLDPEIELIIGDVRDPDILRQALKVLMQSTTWQLTSGLVRVCTKLPSTPASTTWAQPSC